MAEAKDLKPRRVRLLRYNAAPFVGSAGREGAFTVTATALRRPGRLGDVPVRVSSGVSSLPVVTGRPRTAEKVHSLLSTNDNGVMMAMVISWAQ